MMFRLDRGRSPRFAMTTPPIRRWCQFSVRSLLALTALAAAGVCAYVVMLPAWQER
jgi:hypothetical protein